MKTILLISSFLFCLSAFSQTQYEVVPDTEGNEKILKGIITRDLLVKDSAFKWYLENEKDYVPFAKAVEGLKKHSDYELIVFMGTWCHDSHYIIPKFFKLIDASGFPADHITLIGTDRNKKTISHLAEALGVVNVPTIIVMKDGKELGRVVEYGKYGLFDMELGEIVNSQ